MNLTEAIRVALDEHWGKGFFAGTKEQILVKVPQRLDQLTGHSKLLEACRASYAMFDAGLYEWVDRDMRDRTSCLSVHQKLCDAIADAEKLP